MLKKYKEPLLYAALIAIVAFLIISRTVPKITSVFNLEMKIQKKSAEAKNLEEKYKKMEEYEKNKDKRVVLLKKVFKSDITGENMESSFALMFDDVMNMIKYNGVKVFSIKYTYNPEDDVFVSHESNKYNVCQLDLELVSDYKDFENLLTELAKYPYLMRIGQIKMMPYPKDKKILLIQLQLVLYAENTNPAPPQTVDPNAQQPPQQPAGVNPQANPNPQAPQVEPQNNMPRR